MNWKDYEKEVYQYFAQMYPEAKITYDAKIIGHYSKKERQVDMLIEDEVAGFPIKIAVDAKYFSRKVDIKCVESFISMIGDIGANQGLLITQKGYSEAAIKRAHYGPEKIELDVLNFEDLQNNQGLIAIPYSGKNSILLPAPFGWVIDNNRQTGFLACLYQRGLDLKKAQENLEWMYLYFWHKDEKASCIDELVEMQNKGMEALYTNLCINERRSPKRTDNRNTYIRVVTSDQLPCQEVTGYIDCDEFIVFFVLFTKKELESRNLRKLKYILKYSEPLKIASKNKMVQSSQRQIRIGRS
ncbi:MAG: restriction endonuclease [Gemmatimonadetes bacterium]|nr:restriction endonuclease [Gemmatimonadota bacterium]